MKNEPLVTVASITAAVTAALALLVSFGVNVSDSQQTAILGVVAVLAPLVVAYVGRAKVAPVTDAPGEPSDVEDYSAPGEDGD